MTGKTKRVRRLEVLISLQSMLIETADIYEKRSYQNRLEELKLEYRERTGHEYLPPVKVDSEDVLILKPYRSASCKR